MDQNLVVTDRQIDGGEKLVRALAANGFPLYGACWAKTARYPKPYLFLVTGRVEGVDARPSYLQVRAALDELESRWGHWLERVGPFDVMLVAPSAAFGKSILAEYQHYSPGDSPLRTDWLGETTLEGAAYLYPPETFRPPVPAAAAAGA